MKITALFLAVLIASGCVSSSPEAQRQRLHAGLTDREIVTLEVVLHWYQHDRDPKFPYRFNENSGVFSEAVKRKLAGEIREFQWKEDRALVRVSILKIVFPEERFGHADVLVSDPFYATRYVNVFEKKEGDWRIIDSVNLAQGTLNALTTEFNWPAYLSDLKKSRINPPDAQGK